MYCASIEVGLHAQETGTIAMASTSYRAHRHLKTDHSTPQPGATIDAFPNATKISTHMDTRICPVYELQIIQEKKSSQIDQTSCVKIRNMKQLIKNGIGIVHNELLRTPITDSEAFILQTNG